MFVQEGFLRGRYILQMQMSDISPPGEGGGKGYSHPLSIKVCAAQQGFDFEAPDLEWGIHFRGVF